MKSEHTDLLYLALEAVIKNHGHNNVDDFFQLLLVSIAVHVAKL